MNKYELALVLRPELDEEAKPAEVQKIQDLITRFGGTVVKTDDWGKKRLAYPIQKVNEGFYLFIDFEAEGTTPAEIESRVRIMESVLRYLIVRKEA
ncbi:30S ribosomal protein S6 [Lachnospiraceae bacterium NSJ-143]|nr:30S ribosomal protein S6 [Lachnospiraceae bacterium NSJ-143]